MTENAVHMRIEYDNALESKKELLSSEINLLRIMKFIRRYKSLRLKELRLKNRLGRKIKEASANIGKIEKSLPKIKIPRLIKKENREFSKEINIEKNRHDIALERELQEIQEKLRALQR